MPSLAVETALPVVPAAAAIRVPLASVGLQYIAPVLQFAIGVLACGESMPASRRSPVLPAMALSSRFD